MPVVFKADGTGLEGAATLGAQRAPLITARLTAISRPCIHHPSCCITCTAERINMAVISWALTGSTLLLQNR